MSRRRKGRNVHGLVLLDKPEGLSSNQAVQRVRSLYQARKAGHTGTLDPFATGMLPICLGEATKTAAFMLDAAKTYVAQLLLGRSTTTGDTEGETTATSDVPDAATEQVRQVLAGFRGRITQIPPMYSALKHQGQPLYRLARKGQEVERRPREVTIHSLELIAWEPPVLEFRVHCSKGTYVRTLAEDIASEMGSCGHLGALRRLAVDPFREDEMVSLSTLEAMAPGGRLDEALLPPDAGLRDWPAMELDAAGAARFGHGNEQSVAEGSPGLVRVHGPAGQLLGVGEIDGQGRLKVRRLLHLPVPDAP